MKIWIDILTPKQLLFSEPIIEKLGKKHEILCTSREYGEVKRLAKIRNLDLIFVGKHGGKQRISKLEASIDRMEKITKKIKRFSPDLTISFASPEATRVSFGLGIKHIAFCDSPHADAVMRLTMPLIQKLLIPKIIPKKEFSKFGIEEKNIISYNSIDAAVTIKRRIIKKVSPFKKNNKKNILIRIEEEYASYVSKSSNILSIVKKIIKEFEEENIVILCRYPSQIKKIKKQIGKNAKILSMTFDGKQLLEDSDVFIGSGGTMTAEASLLGTPTISYNAVPNIVEEYLVKKHLVKRETDPKRICNHMKKIFNSPKTQYLKKSKMEKSKMENPIEKLMEIINE